MIEVINAKNIHIIKTFTSYLFFLKAIKPNVGYLVNEETKSSPLLHHVVQGIPIQPSSSIYGSHAKILQIPKGQVEPILV